MQPDIDTVLRDYDRWLHLKATDLTPDKELRKDLMQEGRIALWKALDSFDRSRGSLPAWLTFKARGAMFQLLRDMGRKQNDIPMESAREEWDRLVEEPDMPDMIAHSREIMDAVKTLTPKQRLYVFLRFWLDYRQSDLNDYFGYDPGGLWRAAHQGARARLREKLAHLE